MNPRHFRLNEPDVSAEDFKTEILAVNLKNGYYYSLRDGAIPLWRLILEGCDLETASRWLADVYPAHATEVQQDATELVANLENASLICETTVPAVVAPQNPPAWLSTLPAAYAKPVVETYTEMQDLLLLDPVHDVDEAGWPHERVPEVDPA